jgi:hypothetical protein
MLNHLRAAYSEYKARQKFLKSGAVIHAHSDDKMGKTACGLSVYQWEEDPWEYTPLADNPKEVTCKTCLKKKGLG